MVLTLRVCYISSKHGYIFFTKTSPLAGSFLDLTYYPRCCLLVTKATLSVTVKLRLYPTDFCLTNNCQCTCNSFVSYFPINNAIN